MERSDEDAENRPQPRQRPEPRSLTARSFAGTACLQIRTNGFRAVLRSMKASTTVGAGSAARDALWRNCRTFWLCCQQVFSHIDARHERAEEDGWSLRVVFQPLHPRSKNAPRP